MKTIFRAAVALFVGVVAFLVVLVAATELLAPHVWPALIVSLPLALVAGVLGVGFTHLGLRYREEKAETGRASPQTIARLGGFSVGVAAFVVTGTVVTVVLGELAMPLLTSMVFGGFPVGALVGVVAGFLVARRLKRQRGGDGREAQSAA